MKALAQSDGKTSGTKMWFTIASAIVLVKYALAGATIWGHTFGDFDAAGAAMLLSVFGATYVTRQNVKVGSHADTPAK